MKRPDAFNRSNGGGKPDFVLKVGIRGERWHKRVGAAWKTADGAGLNLKLDPGIALIGAHDISITLWPSDEQRQHTTYTEENLDDQIPY